jgi:hypothetical protein
LQKLSFASTATFALLLAACGSDDTPSGANIEAAVNHADALAEAVQNRAEAVPSPAPTGAAQPIKEIPEAFQGRWGLVTNDCDRGRADAKGLLEVAANRLVFYESRATPTSMLQAVPNELTLQLTYAGEGETWQRSTRLTLLDEGRTLVREEQDPAGTFRYTRCP